MPDWGEEVDKNNANLLVVALAWYGFTAIFPLLLVAVSGNCAFRMVSRSFMSLSIPADVSDGGNL